MTIEIALGFLGLVVSIAAFAYGVYSHHQITRAFARSEKAVGIARTASAVGRRALIQAVHQLPSDQHFAFNDTIEELQKYEAEMKSFSDGGS
jgi:hypothetical protein